MAQSLTRSYADLFHESGSNSAKLGRFVRSAAPFVLDAYSSGKLRELTSFALWEVQHRAVFVSSEGTVFVATSGGFYRIGRGNRAFRRSLAFSHPESRPLFPHGITETPDGAIVVGEYGSVRQAGKWSSVANVYLTRDGGQTWDRSERFIESGANKHIHLVHYSPIHRKLIVTDGDNLKRLWLGDWREG